MFDPSIGRWTTEDPELFDAGDVDLYRALSNNPITNTDPEGLAVTKVTVKSAHIPLYGLEGVFAWPVNFELDDGADACDGGWIVQHVKNTINIKGKAEQIIDYWEAWRVKPTKKTSATTRTGADMAEVAQMRGVFTPDERKELRKMEGNDWYWSLDKVPTTGQWLVTGFVYYFDKLGEQAGPGLWGKIPPAGELHAIWAAGNADTIAALLRLPHVGPFDHDIGVSWQKGQKTKEFLRYPK